MTNIITKTKFIFSFIVFAIVFLAGILFSDQKNNDVPFAKAAAAQNVRGFAWSENIGWISFNSLNCDTNTNGFIDTNAITSGCSGNDNVSTPVIDYGVNIDALNNLSGYAWNNNIGWISFQAGDVAGCPSGVCQPRLVGTNFSGWARALAFGGGWDGWISLNSENCDITGGINNGFIDIACGGDNATTPVIDYSTILNGVDFEGFAWSDMVVGWVNFNSKNCDTNGNNVIDIGEDINGCPAVTTNIPNYKVYLSGGVSYAESLQAFKPSNYCNKPPQFSLQWKYKNISGIDQDQYRIQVAIDALYTNLAADVTNFQTISPDGTGTWSLNVVPSPTASILDNDIAYGVSYYWRLQVHSTGGSWSNWIEYDDPLATPASDGDSDSKTFTTEVHEYPDVNFTPPSPNAFIVNDPIQFCTTNPPGPCVANTNLSICYDNSNNPVNCTSYKWDFDYISSNVLEPSTDSTDVNPIHTYTASGTYEVLLRAYDASLNEECSNLDSIGQKILGAQRPKWKEVVPR